MNYEKKFIISSFLCGFITHLYAQDNLALNKPTVVSSLFDDSGATYGGDKAVDGDRGATRESKWISAPGWPQWIEIDLEDTYDVGQVKFWTGRYENTYGYPAGAYQIQGWDGSDWVDLVSRVGNTDGVVDETFDAYSTSKIRLYVSEGVDGDQYLRLFEIEVYEVEVSGDTEAPTSPGNLSVTNVTMSGCRLSWDASTDNVGVETYVIYQDGDSIDNTASTSYAVSGLSTSTAYTFTIKAKDAGGNYSGASNTATVTTLDGEKNLALNKPTVVSSLFDDSGATYGGDKAVDGDRGATRESKWISAPGWPQWIEIDLEDTYDVRQVKFWTGRYENTYGYPAGAYQIQGWDGSDWIDLVSRVGNTDGVVDETFDAYSTSKIRLYVSEGVDGDQYLRLFEIEVYGGSSQSTQENIALNKTVSSESTEYGGYELSNLIDGDTETTWSTDALFPLSAVIDLGAEYSINSTELVVYEDRVAQYAISVAGNDKVYTQVVDQSANTSAGTAEAPIVDEFDAVTARYVKIDISACTGVGNYVTLTEFRVFGDIISSVGEKLNRQLDVVLYPNPVSEILTVSGVKDMAGIEVYSLLGTKVFQDQDVSFPYSVDMSGYKPGTYIVTVISEGNRSTTKVIKE